MTVIAQRVFPLAKELAYQCRFNRGFFDRYPYMFSPAQLGFLCERVSDAAAVDGSIVEVGCAYGATTVFLNRHMTAEQIDRPYVCVDTFSGFVERDVEHEVRARGKRASSYRSFRTNKKKWFERTLQVNGIERATVFACDAATFDFGAVGPIAFCLVDVDLYLPVRAVVERVYDAMPVGGTIVVDDCWTTPAVFDGAAQAYRDVVAALGLEGQIVLGKLGVIRKTSAATPAFRGTSS